MMIIGRTGRYRAGESAFRVADIHQVNVGEIGSGPSSSAAGSGDEVPSRVGVYQGGMFTWMAASSSAKNAYMLISLIVAPQGCPCVLTEN